MAKIKLGIGLPLTNNMVHTGFLDSWVLMRKPAFIYLRPMFPGNIASIRNSIALQAVESDCTHLLMMDTDQTYPPDTIDKLLAHARNGLDIVCGKVHRRYAPFDPILLRGEATKLTMVSDEEWTKNPLIEVDATGGACMMLNTRIFKEMETPWFEDKFYDKVEWDGSIQKRPIGEDIGFFLKAKKLGYKVFVDTTIKIGHLGLLEITEEVYFLHKALNKGK